ncbi:MAG: NAD(P)H-hydrate epimerase, partial [Anaerolineales bacterium]
MKFVSVSEMVAIEKEADRSGLTYDKMMENAGSGLAEVVNERYEFLKPGPILGLVGSGNNGGDTLVAMTHLSNWGWQTQAYLAKPRESDDPLMTRFTESGGIMVDGDDESFQDLADLLQGSALLLDGVLGTGIKLPLRGRVADVLESAGKMIAGMNEPPVVVAVDCPSGVDCDSGETAPECIEAELTVTMAAIKKGLLSFPAYNYVGELQLVGIGLPDDLEAYQSIRRFVPDDRYVQQVLPVRNLDAHKGTFGTALILAGSINYTGAALLAGESAYRIGAGLVTLGVPEPLHKILAGRFLEATWLLLPHDEGAISEEAFKLVSDHLERPTALLIGPGFGLAETTRRFLSHFLMSKDGGAAGENKGSAKDDKTQTARSN